LAVDVDAEVGGGLFYGDSRGAAQVSVGVFAVSEGYAVDAVMGMVVCISIIEEATDESTLEV